MPGEWEIISKIRQRAEAEGRVIIGIGDDAAVIDEGGNTDLIVCCDLMVEEVHFRLRWADPRQTGRKALAVTLSDVAAMGGDPQFALVSVALPPAADSEFIDQFFDGLFDIARSNDVIIIGGDTSSSPGPLFLDTTVIGRCLKGKAVRRAGARAGDRVYVTGSLGASALGLELLEGGARLDCADGFQREAILKHLLPDPRVAFGRAIGMSKLATAMIDISDGLKADLGHILEESGCGAIIDADAIPLAECVRALDDEPLHLALISGEEYELLFTARPEAHIGILECAAASNLRVSLIGEIVKGSGLKLRRGNALEDLDTRGYEHNI